MTNAIQSTNISDGGVHVYENYADAPSISGVYIFEVEERLVKCGMSRNVKKRFCQLMDIKKHREAALEGRAAVLPVDGKKLRRAETAFFSLLNGNIEGTELFKVSFNRALKSLQKLHENNPASMFHLTDTEKAAEAEKAGEINGRLKPLIDNLEVSQMRSAYATQRVNSEISISEVFSKLLELFPESIDGLSFERIKNEYRHYLGLVSYILIPYVWPISYDEHHLDYVTAGRIGALELRLYSATLSTEELFKSSVHPREIIYHAANLVFILEDIKNLYSELIEVDEKYEGKYSDGIKSLFKEARDRADYFIRYLIARFVVACAYPGQDVTRWREDLHSTGKRLHELFKEEERRI